MQTILRPLTIVLEAALVVLSVVLLTFRESNTTPARFALFVLWAVVAMGWLRRTRQLGMLNMTWKQSMGTARQRPITLLTMVALTLSLFAMVVPDIRALLE